MPGQGWRKERIATFNGEPVIGARCPWCGEWWVPCRWYGGAWHADSTAIQYHAFGCGARPRKERKRAYGPRRRKGPDANAARWLVHDTVDPDTPRGELPDELPVSLAAGLAKCDPSRIRQLCRSGELAARKGDVYGSEGWLVDTDALLAWMVATGRRSPGA